jgi:hypothetical protein
MKLIKGTGAACMNIIQISINPNAATKLRLAYHKTLTDNYTLLDYWPRSDCSTLVELSKYLLVEQDYTLLVADSVMLHSLPSGSDLKTDPQNSVIFYNGIHSKLFAEGYSWENLQAHNIIQPNLFTNYKERK